MAHLNSVSKSLHVSNLHHAVSEAMLWEKFCVAGTVTDVHLFRDPTTCQSRGFAHISFKTNAEAKHALETMNYDPIKGNPIKVTWNMHDSSLKSGLKGNIFIKNLNKQISSIDLHKLFSKFGNILSHKVASDENGSKGLGYVNFESEEEAACAIEEMDGVTIGGKMISVQKYIPKSERTRVPSASNFAQSGFSGKMVKQEYYRSPHRLNKAPQTTISPRSTVIVTSTSDFVEKSPTIHDDKLSYLKSMLCGKYKWFCNEKINALFDSYEAKGRLAAVNGSVFLVTKTEASQMKCCKLLEEMIHCKLIEVPKGPHLAKMQENNDLAALVKKKQLKYLGILFTEKGVNVASFNEDDVDIAHDLVKQYVAGRLYTKIFRCNEDVSKFIIKHCGILMKDCLATKTSRGLEVSGAEAQVNSVIQQLNKKSFETDEVSFNVCGLASYFDDGDNDWEDELVEGTRCIISAQKKLNVKSYPNLKRPSTEIKFEVIQGNIADQTTDAVLNGVSSDFNLTWGQISPSLLAKAGNELQRECSSDPIINEKYVRVTKGYKLSCKYVMHVVTPNSSEKLTQRVQTALNQARLLGATSVSVPTLGAGGIGIDALDVAMALREAFTSFVKDNEGLKFKVVVVVFAQALLPLFQTHCIPQTDTLTWLPWKQINTNVETWNVCVTGDAQRDVRKVVENLNNLKSDITAEAEITNSIISDLNKHDAYEIEKLCKEFDSSCLIYKEKAPKIVLSGNRESVTSLDKEISKLLKDLESAKIVAKVSVWEFEKTGQFRSLPLRVSRDLVAAYEKSPQGKCEVVLRGKALKVDFKKMTYRLGYYEGKIRRKSQASESKDVPVEWTPMQGDARGKYLVQPGTEEYNRVLLRFTASGLSYSSIVKIERIQDIALYHQYQIRKRDVERHMQDASHPAERELFHGTTSEIAEKICLDGFDRGFAGRNATAYGKGTYFARDSTLSLNYSQTTSSGFKHMFLALVLTGNYCQGSPHYVAAPPMGFRQKIRLYDSVVNSMSSPTIFVVFKDTSVYPQYLITFK